MIDNFFGQSFSLGHHPPVYHPPKGVYLLNVDQGSITHFLLLRKTVLAHVLNDAKQKIVRIDGYCVLCQSLY